MKYLLMTAAFVMMTTTGFTQTAKTKNLEDQKVLSRNQIDAAISRIEESRPCVNKAQSTEELKNCEMKLRDELKAMSKSTRETRKDIKNFHKKEYI